MMFLEFKEDSHVDAWGEIFRAKLTAYHTCYSAVLTALPDMPHDGIRHITDELIYDTNTTFKKKIDGYGRDDYSVFLSDQELNTKIDERMAESTLPLKVDITEI